MNILNMEQQSEEWFAARQLKMTASHATAIQASGAGLKTYIYELCSEHLSIKEKEHFSNVHTDRGNELEPEARLVYELETGNKVEEVGFCIFDEYSGCSPDGFVKADGLVEIKCPDDKEHLRMLITKEIKPDYKHQMQMQMFITSRKWCDFISYSPNFKKNIVIIRVKIEPVAQDKIKKGIETGKKLIKEILKAVGDGV